MEKFTFEVAENESGIRLDKFLTEKFAEIKPEINRTKIQHLLEAKLVLDEAGKPYANASQKTKVGQKFFITPLPPRSSHLTAKKIPFEIIFEDDDLSAYKLININYNLKKIYIYTFYLQELFF